MASCSASTVPSHGRGGARPPVRYTILGYLGLSPWPIFVKVALSSLVLMRDFLFMKMIQRIGPNSWLDPTVSCYCNENDPCTPNPDFPRPITEKEPKTRNTLRKFLANVQRCLPACRQEKPRSRHRLCRAARKWPTWWAISRLHGQFGNCGAQPKKRAKAKFQSETLLGWETWTTSLL